jgi:hypothetical protein
MPESALHAFRCTTRTTKAIQILEEGRRAFPRTTASTGWEGAELLAMGVPRALADTVATEILLDRGPEYGPEGDIEKAGDRLPGSSGNLVIMQFSSAVKARARRTSRSMGDLPAKSIDYRAGASSGVA